MYYRTPTVLDNSPGESRYFVITISPRLTGLLKYCEDDSLNYTITSEDSGDRIEAEGSSEFVANIINSMDDSRQVFGVNYWKGEFRGGGKTCIDVSTSYGEVSEREELPKRSYFMGDEKFEERDPYNIIEGSVSFNITGQLDLSLKQIIDTV